MKSNVSCNNISVNNNQGIINIGGGNKISIAGNSISLTSKNNNHSVSVVNGKIKVDNMCFEVESGKVKVVVKEDYIVINGKKIKFSDYKFDNFVEESE